MTTQRRGRACALAVVAVGLALGLACEPIVADPGPKAPVNACPAHPCDAYAEAGAAPSCNAGVCTVATPTTDLLLVIAMATDSYLAPGRTYLTTLGAGPLASGTCALPSCSPPLCALPQWTQDQSSYFVDPSAYKDEAHWYLVNSGTTTLPVQATFRRLVGSSQQDALDLGLPVPPVDAVNFSTAPGTPGPGNSAQLQFRTYVQQGCYERTLQPFSPYSTVFPPEITPWPLVTPWPPEQSPIDNFDSTFEETLPSGTAVTVPTFDIARAEGLDGWTAYLRNIHTGRVFSNIAPLTGSLAQGVTLLTKHEPGPKSEALTDLELVVAPPPGTPLPTEVFAPQGTPPAQELASSEVYPSLPTPVTVTGRIRTPAGAPVPADVYFTASDITDRSGQRFPPNFEFSAKVSTTTDRRTGASTYSALLPQGDYQIAVRPTDGSNAVTVVSRAVGGQGNVMTGEDISVAPLVTVAGVATVADGRGLAEAVAEVLPTQCAAIGSAGDGLEGGADASSGAATAGMPGASDACLPRAAQTTTDDQGNFSLLVDPGQYLLRIRPREGSRLPWKIQTITVGSEPPVIGTVMIPAPISVGMQLTDSASPTMPAKNNPVVNAVVRVFTDPSQGGPAVELGQAITDVNGNYEMYIAPLTE